jgi:hypothetical protein
MQPVQVLRIMRKIGVHLEDELIVVFHRPFEPVDIRRSQPQLALTLLEEKLPGVFLLELPDDRTSPVRRTVIDHQHVKTLAQLENSLQDIGDVLFFVVRRYDDDLFQLVLYNCIRCIRDKTQSYDFSGALLRNYPFFNIVLLKISVSFCLVCRGKSPFIIQS